MALDVNLITNLTLVPIQYRVMIKGIVTRGNPWYDLFRLLWIGRCLLAYFPNGSFLHASKVTTTWAGVKLLSWQEIHFSLIGHRTRSDERDQAGYDQFHFSDRLSELGFEGLRRSIRDNSFGPFTELHPGPLQPVKLPPDGTSAFSALAPGK